MTPPTPSQLRMMARLAPDKFLFCDSGNQFIEPCLMWLDEKGFADGVVTDREMDRAVWECEDRLNDVQQRKYAMELHDITDAVYSFGRPENYLIVAHATVSQRLIALSKVLPAEPVTATGRGDTLIG